MNITIFKINVYTMKQDDTNASEIPPLLPPPPKAAGFGHWGHTHLSYRDIFYILHKNHFPKRPLLFVHFLLFFGGGSRAPSLYNTDTRLVQALHQ